MFPRVTLLLGICLLAVFTQTLAERVRYDNYGFYRISPKISEDLVILKDMEKSSDSLIFIEGIHVVDRDVTVVVAPHKQPDFELVLKNNKIAFELIEKNFQTLLDEEIAENEQAKALSKSKLKSNLKSNSSSKADDDDEYDWTRYHTLQETYEWLLQLTSAYPHVVMPIDAGVTYQRRRILGIKISMDKGKKQKPGIFLEGGLHAREWISSAAVTYFINELLTSKDPETRSLAKKYDWYIVPHLNPDGYEYTHTTNRMWRKTRSPQGICIGADPNRNFAFHWAEAGVSKNPCAEDYPGRRALSEIETLSFSRYFRTLRGKIQLYLSFHSYSQLLLFPYGHTSEKAPNHDDLSKVFNVSVNALKARYGTQYTGGNIYDAIYPASGSSMEWAYGTQGVKMAFVYELRPTTLTLSGFRLPASKIKPTSEETWDSVVAMVEEVERLGYFKK